MARTDLAHSLILLGVCISIIGYVFGSVMENQKVRTLLEDLWVALTGQIESPTVLRARTLEIAAQMFGALYHRNGKFSHLKLVMITLIFLASCYIGFTVGDSKFTMNPFEDMRKIPGVFLMAVLWTMIFYLYEYGAYRISRYFLSRAMERNNKIYLGINLAVLLLVIYVLPVLYMVAVMDSPFQNLVSDTSSVVGKIAEFLRMGLFMLVAASPALPALLFLTYDHSNSLFGQLLMLPAALSFCFPVALLLGSLAVLHNRWTLNVLVKSLERVTAVNARRIKRGSLAFLSFVSGASGIISYLMEK